MAIIYSYPRITTLNNSDLLIGTRFENEDNGSARSVSFTAETIGQYVSANYITSYGLASQTANSTPITNTTVAGALNGSEYVGTLTVPANGFSVGDAFNAYLMGHISNSNNTVLTITIETVAGVVLATTGAMTLAISSDNHWQLDMDFVIREVGAAGTASIITSGTFSHNKSANNNLETYSFISENTTTFNTTIANELVIKARWTTASTSNSIYSNVFILNKVY